MNSITVIHGMIPQDDIHGKMTMFAAEMIIYSW